MPWYPDDKTGSGGIHCNFRDEVALGALAVVNVSMILASGCNIDLGFLSLGHAEASKPSDPSFLSALVNQGLIATEAFSVWLSGWKGHTG